MTGLRSTRSLQARGPGPCRGRSPRNEGSPRISLGFPRISLILLGFHRIFIDFIGISLGFDLDLISAGFDLDLTLIRFDFGSILIRF